MKLEYTGKVKDGKLKIIHHAEFDEKLKQFEGKDIEGFIQNKRRFRSLPLNKYYWAVPVDMIQNAFIELGHEVSKSDVHEFLKQRFNYKELIDDKSGEMIKIGQSTTGMTNTEFMNYMEQIKQFAAETLNIIIPDPGEQLTLTD